MAKEPAYRSQSSWNKSCLWCKLKKELADRGDSHDPEAALDSKGCLRVSCLWPRLLNQGTTFHYCWRFKNSWNGIYLPLQLTDWLLVEVALLLIGLTKISQTKSGFDQWPPDCNWITQKLWEFAREPDDQGQSSWTRSCMRWRGWWERSSPPRKPSHPAKTCVPAPAQ